VNSIAVAWLVGLFALTLAGWAGSTLAMSYGITPALRQGVQAIVMSGIVVPAVVLIRRLMDRRHVDGLAILNLTRSAKGFALGSGLILLPTAVTLAGISLFGWAKLSINPAPGVAASIPVAILTAFFFEALPEELLFRGYIYRSLNRSLQRWSASLITVVLFVLLPVVVVVLQSRVLGMNVQIGNTSRITPGYILTLLCFGAFLQYLRVLTNSVWTAIGFHLVFLLSNRIVGIKPTAFILMTNVQSEGPMQALLIGTAVLAFAALFAYPRVSGHALNWGAVDPE
jgi:uncharacterized protein